MRHNAGCRSRACLDHGEVAPDAVAPDRVVAFRERADDRGLVRKVLIERAERHAAAFDDVAHAEGFAAFFSHQLGCAAENFLEPLAAALLGRDEARQRGRASFGCLLSGFSPRHRPSHIKAT